jgi:hypothetical protein
VVGHRRPSRRDDNLTLIVDQAQGGRRFTALISGSHVAGCESIDVVTEYRFSKMETRSMDRSAFKMGSYGGGALWCLKEREGKYITFNSLRIARQEKDGA